MKTGESNVKAVDDQKSRQEQAQQDPEIRAARRERDLAARFAQRLGEMVPSV